MFDLRVSSCFSSICVLLCHGHMGLFHCMCVNIFMLIVFSFLPESNAFAVLPVWDVAYAFIKASPPPVFPPLTSLCTLSKRSTCACLIAMFVVHTLSVSIGHVRCVCADPLHPSLHIRFEVTLHEYWHSLFFNFYEDIVLWRPFWKSLALSQYLFFPCQTLYYWAVFLVLLE